MITEYKTGCPAYLEFTNKIGEPTSGIFFVSDQDRYYLELKDEEVIQLVSKRSIKSYEPDRDKWPLGYC